MYLVGAAVIVQGGNSGTLVSSQSDLTIRHGSSHGFQHETAGGVLAKREVAFSVDLNTTGTTNAITFAMASGFGYDFEFYGVVTNDTQNCVSRFAKSFAAQNFGGVGSDVAAVADLKADARHASENAGLTATVLRSAQSVIFEFTVPNTDVRKVTGTMVVRPRAIA
jgi:hypothetical protein